MELDSTITRVKTLIEQKEKIEAELAEIFGGVTTTKRTVTCGKCGEAGHTARSCTKEAAQ